MDEQGFKKLFDEALKPVIERLDDPNTGLAAINARLDDPNTGLGRINEKVDALWEQTEKVTLGIEEVKETLNSQTTQLNRITTKIEKISEDNAKLDRRLSATENHLGIVPPPELTLIQ